MRCDVFQREPAPRSEKRRKSFADIREADAVARGG
jgi:hypothetical protein